MLNIIPLYEDQWYSLVTDTMPLNTEIVVNKRTKIPAGIFYSVFQTLQIKIVYSFNAGLIMQLITFCGNNKTQYNRSLK